MIAHIALLEEWYMAQCNGVWEHRYGITIETIDNPGWSVSIDLADTELQGKPFVPVERMASESSWLHCRVEEHTFRGHGDPHSLDEILRVFTDWASSA